MRTVRAFALTLSAASVISFCSCSGLSHDSAAENSAEIVSVTTAETENSSGSILTSDNNGKENNSMFAIDKRDYSTQTWIAVDIPFATGKKYEDAENLYVFLDAEFRNRDTGTVLTLPAFWYGDEIFVVRFAPTEPGIWDYVTSCDTDDSLSGITGSVSAEPYDGELEIYRHGFIRPEGKHFVYADGTPFFYLGDTHWNMYDEEFSRGGHSAGDSGADSHFKYIVDKRVEQGFTVYQSEPIDNMADLTDGSLSKADVRMFEKNDRYYQYIAEKGLVHANAEFFFAGSMNQTVMSDTRYMEAISRYWAARYSAYPVIWTLAQEIDNDFYNERGDQRLYDYTNNPWVLIAEYLHKYDAYDHPLSGHQENAVYTTVTGRGTVAPDRDNGGQSVFLSDDVSERTGHNWWAVQWQPNLTSQIDDEVPKDYWESPKTAINYESRYCCLWTKDYGARAQSWIAMLSGFAGCGYGAIDIWLYDSNYNVDEPSNDGLDTITVEDKALPWSVSVDFESAWQQGYMRRFFESFNWWELTPDFNDRKRFIPDDRCVYTCASVGDERYIVYMYSKDTTSGIVSGLDPDALYEASWFNPRTAEYIAIGDIRADMTTVSGAPGWKAPDRPEPLDFVLTLTKK